MTTVSDHGQKTTEEPKPYWPELDGLRWFAFSFVFLAHANLQSRPTTNSLRGRVFSPISTVCDWGWIGVDLFFVLSGFLVTRLILLESKKLGAYRYDRFLIRRALRIWPHYFLIVVIGYLVFPLFPSFSGVALGNKQWYYMVHRHLPLVVLFAGNLSYSIGLGHVPMITFLWSVCIEEQFYLFWGGFLRLVNRPKTIWALLGFALVAAISTRAFLWGQSHNYASFYFHSVGHADPLILGACIGLLESTSESWKRFLVRNAVAFFWGGVGLATSLIVFLPPLGANDGSLVWGLTAIAISCAMVLLGVMNWVPARRFLSLNFFVRAGRLTYAMYLLHQLCQGLVHLAGQVWFGLVDPTVLWGFVIVVGLVMTLIGAWISWHLVERPFRSLRLRESVHKGANRAAGPAQIVRHMVVWRATDVSRGTLDRLAKDMPSAVG